MNCSVAGLQQALNCDVAGLELQHRRPSKRWLKPRCVDPAGLTARCFPVRGPSALRLRLDSAHFCLLFLLGTIKLEPALFCLSGALICPPPSGSSVYQAPSSVYDQASGPRCFVTFMIHPHTRTWAQPFSGCHRDCDEAPSFKLSRCLWLSILFCA